MENSIREMLEAVLDNLQRLQHQQLLSDAVFTEFIEETSRQFDQVHYLIDALKAERADLDQQIEAQRIDHLKRQILAISTHLYKLKERASLMGLETPVHIEVQIEEYEKKLAVINEQLERFRGGN